VYITVVLAILWRTVRVKFSSPCDMLVFAGVCYSIPCIVNSFFTMLLLFNSLEIKMLVKLSTLEKAYVKLEELLPSVVVHSIVDIVNCFTLVIKDMDAELKLEYVVCC